MEGEGALPAVLADPRGLRTVITNLLQNAVAFSPEPTMYSESAVRYRIFFVSADTWKSVTPEISTSSLRLLKSYRCATSLAGGGLCSPGTSAPGIACW